VQVWPDKKTSNYIRPLLYWLYFGQAFFVSYLLYHFSTTSTKFGGQGLIRYIYFFILQTRIYFGRHYCSTCVIHNWSWTEYRSSEIQGNCTVDNAFVVIRKFNRCNCRHNDLTILYLTITHSRKLPAHNKVWQYGGAKNVFPAFVRYSASVPSGENTTQ
jgi:hypothetical protein